MSAAKHTPGPWALHPRFTAEVWAARRRIANCKGLGEERTDAANARLIAAAPDLLDVLIQCRAVLSTVLGETSADDEPKHSVLTRRIQAADAVIAKAREVQP